MPQHKSALKRVRQNATRRLRNRSHISRVRTMIKQLRATSDPAAATELLNEAKSYLDRLATKGVIHKSKAANTKSGLDRYVSSLT